MDAAPPTQPQEKQQQPQQQSNLQQPPPQHPEKEKGPGLASSLFQSSKSLGSRMLGRGRAAGDNATSPEGDKPPEADGTGAAVTQKSSPSLLQKTTRNMFSFRKS
jgi:hypothetical protein